MSNRIDVTRFPFGVSNAGDVSPWGQLGLLDPTKYHVLYEEFDRYLAADWVVTETQAGATQALTSGDGGLLLITNSAADNDVVALQWAGSAGAVVPTFTWTSGKRLATGGRFTTSNATECDVAVGLYVADTSPIATPPSDGIYILKADDATSFVARVGNTSNYTVSSAVGALVATTQIDVAVVYDGLPIVIDGVTYHDFDFYINGSKLATARAPTANVPTAALALSFAFQNGSAVAHTSTWDYVYAVKER